MRGCERETDKEQNTRTNLLALHPAYTLHKLPLHLTCPKQLSIIDEWVALPGSKRKKWGEEEAHTPPLREVEFRLRRDITLRNRLDVPLHLPNSHTLVHYEPEHLPWDTHRDKRTHTPLHNHSGAVVQDNQIPSYICQKGTHTREKCSAQISQEQSGQEEQENGRRFNDVLIYILNSMVFLKVFSLSDWSLELNGFNPNF